MIDNGFAMDLPSILSDFIRRKLQEIDTKVNWYVNHDCKQICNAGLKNKKGNFSYLCIGMYMYLYMY